MSSRILLRLCRSLALVIGLPLLFLFLYQSRLIYFPQRSSPEMVARFLATGGKRLDYQTRDGAQTAWLRPALTGNTPERFWIVCAGNASEALSFEWLQAAAHLPNDAFLLVDYPGYGASEGKPTPDGIRANLEKVVPLATAATGFPIAGLSDRGLALGHSLGAAATLLGAEIFGIRRVVLLAPFTSTMEIASVVVHLPLGWLVSHRYDNRARLIALKERGGHAWIHHGVKDEAIPVWMGRSLARELGDAASYREVADGWHNDLFEVDHAAIFQSMREAR